MIFPFRCAAPVLDCDLKIGVGVRSTPRPAGLRTLDLVFTLARRFLKYGALLGVLVSLLTVLFWGVLFYIRADGVAQSQGLEAAIFLLTTIVSFPLSILTVAALGSVEYPVALVRLAIVGGPILNLALWGYVIGAAADALLWLRDRFAPRRKP